MKPESIKSKNDWNIKKFTQQTNTCSNTIIETLEQGGE